MKEPVMYFPDASFFGDMSSIARTTGSEIEIAASASSALLHAVRPATLSPNTATSDSNFFIY
jgi:hypothetical protein